MNTCDLKLPNKPNKAHSCCCSSSRLGEQLSEKQISPVLGNASSAHASFKTSGGRPCQREPGGWRDSERQGENCGSCPGPAALRHGRWSGRRVTDGPRHSVRTVIWMCKLPRVPRLDLRRLLLPAS